MIKTYAWPLAVILVLCAVNSTMAQGSLTPPGPPGPTMKTLTQVEPRTPIGSIPYTISQSGSYYLTTNCTLSGAGDGITIEADNVTLDLMGFTLRGGDGSGIVGQSGREQFVIRNGHIRGWGQDGILLDGCSNAVLRDVCSTDNGRDGFNVGDGALVVDCVATGNSDDGFSGNTHNRFERCRAAGNPYGFYVPYAKNQIKECTATGATGIGIRAGSSSVVKGNTITDNTGTGLSLWDTGSYVADNIVRGNVDNYDIPAGNQLNLLLCELPETLDWPCSVKLAGTLTGQSGTNGITINASDVTIDLDGHALVGVPGSLGGIVVTGQRDYMNIEIRNGIVRDWGGQGVDTWEANNSLLVRLRAYNNGWESGGDGLRVGLSSLVENCVAMTNQSYGIKAYLRSVVKGCTANANGHVGITATEGTVIGCAASQNANDGIWAPAVSGSTATSNGGYGIDAQGGTVRGCAAFYNGAIGIAAADGTVESCKAGSNGAGISVSGGTVRGSTANNNTGNGITGGDGSMIKDCVSNNNGGDGIHGGNYNTLTGCTAKENTGDGIEVSSACHVFSCLAGANGNDGDGAGIYATGENNRIDGNTVTRNDRGLDIEFVGGNANLIIRNSASDNGTDFDIAAGNKVGTIQTTPVGAGPWDNFQF